MTPTSGKQPYGRKFLREQRERLVVERAAALQSASAGHEELLDWRDNADAGVDQHMADDATALSEQELDLTLVENARYIVSEIDEALQRMDEGTYGWDEEARVWIREERLQALPWARREVEGQRRLEEKLRRDDRDSYEIDTDVQEL